MNITKENKMKFNYGLYWMGCVVMGLFSLLFDNVTAFNYGQIAMGIVGLIQTYKAKK